MDSTLFYGELARIYVLFILDISGSQYGSRSLSKMETTIQISQEIQDRNNQELRPYPEIFAIIFLFLFYTFFNVTLPPGWGGGIIRPFLPEFTVPSNNQMERM